MADYSTLTIKFYDGSNYVTFRGESNTKVSSSQIQYHSLYCFTNMNITPDLPTLHHQQ